MHRRVMDATPVGTLAPTTDPMAQLNATSLTMPRGKEPSPLSRLWVMARCTGIELASALDPLRAVLMYCIQY